MTHLVNHDTREVTNLHPDRLYTVAMQASGFQEVISGIIFRDSVSQGALDTARVLSLRACGFQFHVFPFTAGMAVCWPFGLDAAPVGYVGEESEAVELAKKAAKVEAEAVAKAVAERRSAVDAMKEYESRKSIAKAAAEGLKKAKAAEAAAREALDAAKEKRKSAEAAVDVRVAEMEKAKAAASKKMEPKAEPEAEPKADKKKKKKGKK
jgi:hypothetical protein